MRTAKAKEIPVNVVGLSKFGRYSKISSEKTYNMYVSDGWLVDFSGWKKRGEVPESNVKGRGIFRSVRNNLVVTVIGSGVFIIDINLTAAFIGNLSSSSGAVTMDENLNSQVCIVDGINCYILNLSQRSLTKQTSTDSFTPNYVSYHNTYFLFGNGDFTGNGAKWFAFVYETPTTIEYFAEFALQTKPDFALAVKRLPGQSNNVLVFGSSVCEIQTNVGGQQVYQRNSSLSIDYGCLSVNTIDASDKIMAWLAINQSNMPVIMVFTPSEGAVPISTDGIDGLLGSLNNPSKSSGYFFRKDGHLFYVLTFYDPSDNFTLAYDFTTKGFSFLTDENLNYHPARQVVYFNNSSFFCSLNDGAIYETGTQFTTYNNNVITNFDYLNHEIPRVRISDNIRNPNSEPFRVNLVTLTIEQGNDNNVTGLSIENSIPYITTEDGEPLITESGDLIISEEGVSIPYIPKVMMSYSVDGGKTWSQEVTSFFRQSGVRQNIMQWYQLGMMNDFVCKFRFCGKDRFVVNNAIAEIF